MSVNLMPTRTKYTLVWGTGETDNLLLDTDPRAWQDNSVGFTRGDDSGINAQVVVGLSFSGAAKAKIKEWYETYGAYARMTVVIDKRQNDWQFDDWYQYRLDFKTYKISRDYVEISGLEEGLLNKIQKFSDTEYEIPLPTSNKNYLNYTGATVYKTNQVQAFFGKISEKSGIGEDMYVIGGKRAVRTYNPEISFTDTNGDPYETMSLRAVPTTTFDLKLNLKLTIIANGTLRNPGSGLLRIYSHNTDFTSPTLIATSPSPTETSVDASKRTDVFNWVTELSGITLTSGKMLSVFYDADNGAFDSINVDEASDAYIEIGDDTASAYQNKALECFTYEWLIEQLLTRIYPDVAFTSEITYTDYRLALSATPCIINMGQTSGTGVIKTSLSDVLRSFNIHKFIGFDIAGDNFTVKPRAEFYKYNATIHDIESNNIVIEHDPTHQYKTVKVGSSVNERGEDSAIVYPFIGEKVFETTDCEFDAELDLVDKFMVDPYDIDDYIQTTLSDVSSKDECKLMVFACLPITSTTSNAGGVEGSEVLNNSGSQPIQAQTGVNYDIPMALRKYDAKVKVICSCNTPDNFTAIDFIIEIREGVDLIQTFFGSGSPSVLGYTTTNEISKESNINISYIQNYEIAEYTLSTTINLVVNSTFVYSESKDVGNNLYKDHIKPITKFLGDSNTIYNIPLTPKRILQNWASYLKISTYGNATGYFNFLTSDFLNSDITSRCGFETNPVIEEADYQPTVTPLFLPILIKFSAAESFEGLDIFETKKYDRYRVTNKKTNKQYVGWIKDFTFAVSKNKQQEYVLQAQSI